MPFFYKKATTSRDDGENYSGPRLDVSCRSSVECAPPATSLEEGVEKSRIQTAQYKKRHVSAPVSDQDYEVDLCCLLFLRAFRFTSNFFLACNHDLAGTFDNVVLFYRLEEDPPHKYRAIVVQAKHKDSCTEEVIGTINPFSLEEHLNSVKNLMEVIELLEISLVLYSKTDGSVLGKLQRLRGFVNAGGGRFLRILEPQETGMLQEQEQSDFPGKILQCAEQTNFVEEELCKVLELPSMDIAGKLASELKCLVKAWWSEQGTGRYLTAESQEWSKVLEMQVKRLNRHTLHIGSQLNFELPAVILRKIYTLLDSAKKSWISVKNEYQAAATRASLLKALRNCLVLGIGTVRGLLCEVEALWGTALCQTLVVDMSAVSQEKCSLLKHLGKALQSHVGRRLVVIAKDEPAEVDWSVLEAGQIISEQGDAVSHTPCLQRTCSKTINFDMLQNTNTLIFSKDLFFISKVTFNNGFKVSTSFNLKAPNEIEGPIFVEGVSLDLEIRKLCSKFRVRGISGEMGSKGFAGDVTEFIPFTWMSAEKVVVVEGLPGEGMSSFMTAMYSSVKEQFPEALALWVDMAKRSEIIKRRDFKNGSDFKEFLLKGLPKDLQSLERDLLEHSLTVTGNVFLFLDAFDEISPDFTTRCCELLKGIAHNVRFRQMVVTTRPGTTKDVQEALETEAFNLPVFSEEEQTLFLERFSLKAENTDDESSDDERTDYKQSEDESADEEEIISYLRQSSGEVLEVPLHCKISDPVSLHRYDDIIYNYADPWRNVLLYKLIVDQSVEERLVKIFPYKDGTKNTLESVRKQSSQDLQELAVRKLIPSFQRNLVSTSTQEKVDFEHRTFAEYFLGCWLSQHWRQCPQELLRDVLFQDGSELVAATLSWSLFEDLPLHVAVAQGDEVAVRALLAAATTDRGGRSALHVAAMTRGNNRQVWELLVASGKSPNAKDDVMHWSAIKYAEIFGNWEMVDFLLEEGAEPHELKFITDENAAREVVLEVIKKEAVQLFRLILGLHERILLMRFDYERNSLLHLAAAEGSLRIAQVLSELHHPVDVKNDHGDSPLHIASRFGRSSLVRFLLENGADCGSKNAYGDTALMDAALNDHADSVKILLDKGADPNLRGYKGDTALTLAAKVSQGESVRLLLEKGAKCNIINKKGHTALTLAVRKGRQESVRHLLEKGVKPDVNKRAGVTALILAAMKGHLETVRLLLKHGADPNKRKGKNGKGTTALIEAAWSNHPQTVRILIENGADHDLRDSQGKTALIWVVERRHMEIVRLLLEMGADPDVKSTAGDTALIVAAKKGHLETVKVLLEAGAAFDKQNEGGLTSLIVAAKKGHLEMVKVLLEAGAALDIQNVRGDTALIVAWRKRKIEVVKLLLAKGADSKVRNAKCKTIFEIAHDVKMLQFLQTLSSGRCWSSVTNSVDFT